MAYSGGEPCRLVLLGKTGVGKSSVGNTILGEDVFKSEARDTSVTTTCSKESRVIDSRSIAVIDTPGLYDSKLFPEYKVKEIAKGVQLSAPGPHAFLLVTDVRRFTQEDKIIVEKFQKVFGDGVYKHMIVLFTRGDDLENDNKTIETFIDEAGSDLKSLISACGQRYHVFNNRRREDRSQVTDLFQKIDQILSANNQNFYSSELFTMATGIEQDTKRIAELEAKVRELLPPCRPL